MNKELAIRILSGEVLGTNEQTHEAVFMAIKALVEAEPVVHCKDCKHYKPSAVVDHNMCFRKDVDGTQVCYDFQPDDYCAYGERREDEIN